MKMLFVVILCLSTGAAAIAQSEPGSPEAKEKVMKHLRDDVRAHEATKKVVGSDVMHFRVSAAFRDHQQVAKTHRAVDGDRKLARAEGITHPVIKARRQVHAEDANVREHS